MKKLISFIIYLVPLIGFSQFSVGYFQSSIPYVGFNYEIQDRYKPELRIGTDLHFEDFSIEVDFTYDILNKEEYEFYAGLGYKTGGFSGIVIPVGLNIFPFKRKSFGFLMELSPIISESSILRGSLGIRYRFLKE
jgi:hypothetical protein